ncbi:MAG TPA: hypothetical protein VLI05_03855 [Candidatus Saccharimonadia bacterium]|nr:hypothetical protein [Candidatus Saccharimonadia bacterium]
MEAQDIARTILFVCNLRLAILDYFTWPETVSISRMDRLELNYLGLMWAVHVFNPNKGGRFITIARQVIWQRASMEAKYIARTIRRPARLTTLSTQIQTEQSRRAAQGQPPWTDQELIDQGVATPSELAELRRYEALDIRSFEWLREANPDWLEGRVANHGALDPAVSYIRREEAAELRAVIEEIHPHLFRILELRYSSPRDRLLTYRNIGQRLGLSPHEVETIATEGLEKLRQHFTHDGRVYRPDIAALFYCEPRDCPDPRNSLFVYERKSGRPLSRITRQADPAWVQRQLAALKLPGPDELPPLAHREEE